MIDRVGLIGIGHLASYLVEGLRRASRDIEIFISPRNLKNAQRLADRFRAIVTKSNQEVVDETDIILLTTRPEDTMGVAKTISFQAEKTVISVAAGLQLENIKPYIKPATLIRAMPISCAAINQSPTIIYPDNPQAQALFSLLGQVHILETETHFTPASVISAFYGWIFALFDEIVSWTTHTGVPKQIAHNLVLETVRGAANMVLNNPDTDIKVILDALTTPGGITEQGFNVLNQKQGFIAWIEALDTVLIQMSRIPKEQKE
jgi:pyrroline-5-carboxylate reductase